MKSVTREKEEDSQALAQTCDIGSVTGISMQASRYLRHAVVTPRTDDNRFNARDNRQTLSLRSAKAMSHQQTRLVVAANYM